MKKNFYKRVHDNFIHEPATSLIGILWYFAAFCGFLVWTSILSGFGFGTDLLPIVFDFLDSQGGYINTFGMIIFVIFGVSGTFYFLGLIWAIFKTIKNN
jgi:hypothetical protein